MLEHNVLPGEVFLDLLGGHDVELRNLSQSSKLYFELCREINLKQREVRNDLQGQNQDEEPLAASFQNEGTQNDNYLKHNTLLGRCILNVLLKDAVRELLWYDHSVPRNFLALLHLNIGFS